MKKFDLGQAITILANLGVIAGIVFLVFELRQNSQALLVDEVTLRAEELTRLDELDRQRQLSILENPEIRELYVKSLYSPAELSLDEIWGMSAYLNGRVSILRRTYEAYQDEILTEEDWDARLSSAPFFLKTAYGTAWWRVTKGDFAMLEGFVEAIDNELVESTATPDDKWLQDLGKAIADTEL